jgi:choline-sulfatase
MRLRKITIAFCLIAGSVAWSASAHDSAQPDVFLVTIDTLRADHVHCYGNDRIRTPALDSLAQDGIRFTQAFTPSPITNTSHTSILTGLLPSSHGVTDFGIPLAPDHETLAELLQEMGYHTAAFIGSVILDSNTLAPGLDRGFEFYNNFPQDSQTKSRWGRLERRGMDVVKDAEKWLDKNPSRPVFVWVHLYDPHDPYEPPMPFSEIYRQNLYDGEIAYADSALGNLVAFLELRKRYRQSLFIVVGDHGEGLGEHHEDTHGIFLYDSTTHVPLLLKLPDATNSGRVVDSQVRTIDILPTVLDLLHAPAPAKLDGQSLLPYAVGTDTADRLVLGETDYPRHFGWAPLHSVRSQDFKLIEAPRPELYRLKADPAELKNIYHPSDSTVATLRKLLFYPAETTTLPDPKDRIEEHNLLHAAMLAQEDNRPELARSALVKTIALDPQSWLALKQLGELELANREYSSAIGHLRTARSVHPGDPATALDEGIALQKSGKPALAQEALEASLKLSPEQFSARLLLGAVYLELKKLDPAEDQLEAALLLQPKSIEAGLALAKVQIAKGKFSDALEQLRPLCRVKPEIPESFELIAQAYSGIGKEEEAHRALEEANRLRKSPTP